jgi:hypothetical protein
MGLSARPPETKLPMDVLLRGLESGDVRPDLRRNVVQFERGGRVTSIRFEKPGIQTHDGLMLDEVISVSTVLPGMEECDVATLGQLNTYVGMSALVRSGPEIRLVSRLPLFRGESAITEYAVFLAMSALLQSFWPGEMSAWMASDEDVINPELPGAEDPSRWTKADFMLVSSMLRQRGLLATDDETGLTAEFPWAPGAVTAVLHHRTSLFRLKAAQHPFLGNGLLCRLELPACCEPAEAAAVSAAMNISEATATDAPPFFGAWHPVPDAGRIAYVSFQPNLLRPVAMHATTAMWSMARSFTAKELLDTVGSRA